MNKTLIATIGVIILAADRGSGQAAADNPAKPGERSTPHQASALKPPSESEATALVKRALAVRKPDEVAAVIRPGPMTPEEVVDALQAISKENGEPVSTAWLGSIDKNGMSLEGVEVAYAGNGKKMKRLAILTPDASGVWKMDFPAFARQVKPSWKKLLAGEESVGKVRVSVARHRDYKGPFQDEAVWAAYSMVSPDMDELLVGYCKRRSAQYEAMELMCSNLESPWIRATLEISRVAGGDRRQFEITRVLAEDWVMAERPFDEMEPAREMPFLGFRSVPVPVRASHPLDEWHERAPLPTFRELQDLAHDGNRYILLDGDPDGRALVSDDGDTFAWQDLKLPERLTPTRIVHADNSYVLLAGGRIWQRPDWGAEWGAATGLGESIAEIRATGDSFWAWSGRDPFSRAATRSDLRGNRFEVNSTLYRSKDGRDWAPVALILEAGARVILHDLIQAKGQFVLSGTVSPSSASSVGLWTSTDGTKWTPVPAEGMRRGTFGPLCEGAGRIVAGGSGGAMAVSDDGLNWSFESHQGISPEVSSGVGSSYLPLFGDLACQQIIYMGGSFHALVGSRLSTANRLSESKDGITWRNSTLLGDSNQKSVRAAAGTQSGVNHAPAPENEARFTIGEVTKIRKIGDKLFLLGLRGKLWATSEGGKGFRNLLPTEPWDWATVSANNSRVVVAGDGGHIAWSDDAISFHHQLLPEAADVEDSVWVQELGLFVAVGGKAGVGRAWSSKDATGWKAELLPGFTNSSTGIAWDGSRLIACGEKGQLATSTDGISWRPMESPIVESLAAIKWADGHWVATTTDGLVLTSPDANSWRSQQVNREGRGYERIAFGNGVWMLSDRDSQLYCLRSEDLEEWNLDSSHAVHRVSYAFGEFIGASARHLMSSPDGNRWQLHYDSDPLEVFHEGYRSAARFRDQIVVAGANGLIGTSGVWKNYFDEWQRAHFNAAELASPSVSGPAADPDRDGWPNALEYALDYDPKVVNRCESPFARFDKESNEYLFSNDSIHANGGIQIQVPAGKGKPGVVVWPERSTDLVHWTRGGMRIAEDRSAELGFRFIIGIPDEFGKHQVVRLRWQVVKGSVDSNNSSAKTTPRPPVDGHPMPYASSTGREPPARSKPYSPPVVHPRPLMDPRPVIKPDESIDHFIKSANLPNNTGVGVLIDLPARDLRVFKVDYRRSQDRASGGLFCSATGIKHGNKIGWISIQDHGLADVSKMVMYDFDASDTYLYSEEFSRSLKSKNNSLYWGAFLPEMAKDKDVPRDVLLKIAEGLSSYIHPRAANLLLENPIVKKDREILTIIANLRAEAYLDSRSRSMKFGGSSPKAQALLDAMPSEKNDGQLAGSPEQVAAVPEPEKNLTVDLGGGVTMDFVLIRPGSFTMGSENEAHKVTLTQPFYLGKYEVTQEQWEKVMGSNPSKFKGAKNPVENVSWADCQSFVAKLKEILPDQTFRLPTEAEWEYACRAGSVGDYCYGDGEDSLAEYAWYRGNANNATHQVGAKKPNGWGLYDLHGNVWEWCADWYGDYPATAVVDPQGPSSGTNRVFRGGSWHYFASYCRAAYRDYDNPSYKNSNFGLRLVRSSGP